MAAATRIIVVRTVVLQADEAKLGRQTVAADTQESGVVPGYLGPTV
jgi:hypothetical protein